MRFRETNFMRWWNERNLYAPQYTTLFFFIWLLFMSCHENFEISIFCISVIHYTYVPRNRSPIDSIISIFSSSKYHSFLILKVIKFANQNSYLRCLIIWKVFWRYLIMRDWYLHVVICIRTISWINKPVLLLLVVCFPHLQIALLYVIVCKVHTLFLVYSMII